MTTTTRRIRKDANMVTPLRFDQPEPMGPGGPISPNGTSASSENSSPGSISAAMQALRANAQPDRKDQQAASLIFQRYFDKLVRRLKGQIHRKLQAVSDSDDLASYALSEVIRYLEEGRYPDLRNREGLWAMLVAVGQLRLKQRIRDGHAGVRNIELEVGQADGSAVFEVQARTRELPPDFWPEVFEQLGVLIGRLKPTECKVLALELQGYETKEMEARLSASGVTIGERHIRRLRDRIQDELRIAFDLPGKLAP